MKSRRWQGLQGPLQQKGAKMVHRAAPLSMAARGGVTFAPISRRAGLGGALSWLGGTPAGAAAETPGTASVNFANAGSLKTVGQASGVLFGLVASSRNYGQQRTYYDRLAQECSLLSPNNDFNWVAVEKQQGQPVYADLDIIADFARQRGLRLLGHNLIWYYTVPTWAQASEPTAFKLALDGYITRSVTRFADIVQRWDVVNEPLDPQSPRPDGLRQSAFLLKLGPGYITAAFQTARAAAPHALLCLNEYGFEYKEPEQLRKRENFVALLRTLRQQNAPIDVIGLQSHLDASKELDLAGMVSLVREVRALGCRIAVTELDVIDNRLPADISQRDRMVADHADAYLGAVCGEMKPISITAWGFTNGQTWLKMWHKRADGLPLRTLPFDDEFNRTPLWHVIAKYIQA